MPPKPKTISEALKPQPKRQPTSADKSALKAFNAGQPLRSDGERLPYQEPPAEVAPRSFRDVFNPGRFRMDTSHGILSARGAGAGGGSGEGGGGGGGSVPAFAAEAIGPPRPNPAFAAEMMATPAPQGTGPAGGVGSFKAALSARPKAQVQAQAAPQPATGRTYSQGRLATMDAEAKRPQAMALYQQSLRAPRSVGEAMRAAINGGDLETAQEAAAAASGVVTRASDQGLADRVWEKFRMRQQAEAAVKAADRQRYSEVAQRNTLKARGASEQAMRMGLDPLAAPGQVQSALRANLGLVDSATLRKMLAEDPTNGAARAALAQAQERERKHLQNQTMQQAKLDAEARKRKADEEALKFEREVYLKGLEVKGKRGAGTEGVTEKQEFEGFRDAVRQKDWDIQKDGGFEEYQRRLHGYSPGVMGRLQEGAYNAMSGLGDVVSAPIQALAGRPAGIPAHLGVQQPPQPQATPIPPALVQPPPGVQPMAWSKALSYVQDLTPEEQAQIFGGKTPEEQQRILAQFAQ